MRKIKRNTTQIFYALTVTLAFYLLISIKGSTSLFEIGFAASVSFLIYNLAIYSTLLNAKNKLIQLGIPSVERYTGLSQRIYHNILPAILFFAFFIFIYFNILSGFNGLLLLTTFFSFLSLFINIRSYYEDKFNLEMSTHFIYGFIPIFALFTFTNAVANVFHIYEIPSALSFPILSIVNLILLSLSLNESLQNNYKLLNFIVPSAVLNGLASSFILNMDSPIKTAFISSVTFYFIVALIHHRVEHTLKFIIVLEYFVVAVLAFVLLFST